MPSDLTTRLRDYRPVLDAAIVERQRAGTDYIADVTALEASPGPRPGRGRRLAALATVSVLVAAGAVGVTIAAHRAPASQSVTPAAPPDSGRLLLEAPGWRVSRADEQDGRGEMTFTNGSRDLELRWTATSSSSPVALAKDRASTSDLHLTTTAAGRPADIYRYAGTDDYSAVWTDGQLALELRGRAATAQDFTELTGRLRPVDIPTWEAALPASVVKPAARAATVDAMLQGVALPPGFDAAPLRTSSQSKDRYQLGAAVAGAVACQWIGQWIGATATGDTARAAAAVQGMKTSRQWPLLLEMDKEGGYSGVVWEYADAIAGDGTIMGGKRVTVQESYRSSLGCP